MSRNAKDARRHRSASAEAAQDALRDAIETRTGHLCEIIRDGQQPPEKRRLAASQLGEIVGRVLSLPIE